MMNIFDDIIYYNDHRYIINSFHNNLDKIDVVNKSVIDFGCGSGDFIKYILNFKPRSITGIDIGYKNIDYCKRNIFSNYTSLNFKKSDLCLIDLEKEKYDLIWSDTVIEFLETDLENIIKQFSIALKSGGILYISFTKRSLKNLVIYNVIFFYNFLFRNKLNHVIEKLIILRYKLSDKNIDSDYIKNLNNKIKYIFLPYIKLIKIQDIKKLLLKYNFHIIYARDRLKSDINSTDHLEIKAKKC